jgi:prepilin-type N-terminal cleavage/methylation domain-containing protein
MSKRGFTLVELLVVIVIIGILMSLVIPVVIHCLGVGKTAAAELLMAQLVQNITLYEQTTMKLPPGDGSGTRALVKALREPGPKGMPFMDIADDLLTPEGDLINPVHPEGEAGIAIIHYRNNSGRKPGPDGVGRPGISSRRPYDLWAAGTDYDSNRPDSAWRLHRP